MYFYFCLRLNGMCLSDFFCCSHLHIQAMEENGTRTTFVGTGFPRNLPSLSDISIQQFYVGWYILVYKFDVRYYYSLAVNPGKSKCNLVGSLLLERLYEVKMCFQCLLLSLFT
uniref:Uncharacterized protein n=1 Tax=Spongospora subterranea TaxID=70186 RepID=A0A0H5R7B9_9EUKA|eukprot:CRZ04189.1 hypothetical protein [Spongospora subterranea]